MQNKCAVLYWDGTSPGSDPPCRPVFVALNSSRFTLYQPGSAGVLGQRAESLGMMETSWELTIQNTSTHLWLLKVSKSSQVLSNKSEFLSSFAIFYCAHIVSNEAALWNGDRIVLSVSEVILHFTCRTEASSSTTHRLYPVCSRVTLKQTATCPPWWTRPLRSLPLMVSHTNKKRDGMSFSGEWG